MHLGLQSSGSQKISNGQSKKSLSMKLWIKSYLFGGHFLPPTLVFSCQKAFLWVFTGAGFDPLRHVTIIFRMLKIQESSDHQFPYQQAGFHFFGLYICPGIPKTIVFKVFNGTTIIFLRDLNNKNRSTFVLMVLEA